MEEKERNMGIEFIDKQGTFCLKNAERSSYLYFPLANEQGMRSCVTPLLGGDAKGDQNTFLLQPVSSEELHNNRSTRNFWCRFSDGRVWSATGVSAAQEAERFSGQEEKTELLAGMMWHKITRTAEKLGIRSEVTSYVPYDAGKLEVMMVTIENIGTEEYVVTPIAAVPLYARSADNIRDHRHVTSLLHRIRVREEGVFVTPTLTFDERGHQENKMTYGAAGYAQDGSMPQQFYPTVEMFLGEGGTYLAPEAVYRQTEGRKPQEEAAGYPDELCGCEAMGAFAFDRCTLGAGEKRTYVVLLGMASSEEELRNEMKEYGLPGRAQAKLEDTRRYWRKQNNVFYTTGNDSFDQWMYWVDFQPMLRRIYGCSFLPHHDYGKGGKGWRDLWQDCLALLVMNPETVRPMLVDNFAGVRYDGSNATIIGEKQGEFIADRNHITRVWMDHGVWPFLTTELYIRQTGDLALLREQVPFFKDAQSFRGERYDENWEQNRGNWLLTKHGDRYEASILEHLLVQHLTSFYDVGEHGQIRLRGADWNDAIDMAKERGESVAFTAAYAGNFNGLAELLAVYQRKTGQTECALSEELFMLLPDDPAVYEDAEKKRALLYRFFEATACCVSGAKKNIPIERLEQKLRAMAEWMKRHIREQEWIGTPEGMHWYNGYYDNHGQCVEGMERTQGQRKTQGKAPVRMMLTSQVFTIMSGTATDAQVREIVRAADRYLYDEKTGGYRLNTNFHEVKLDMGRMFGFAYGHKENGAVFCHMAVMYANALYQREFVQEGYRVIRALFGQCMNFSVSRIYPGIPEYFNAKGRGMYHYLTGAASWLMLTVLSEIFGVKGAYGDLMIAPKLVAEQFDAAGCARVNCGFAGKNIEVRYCNSKRKEYGAYEIREALINGVKTVGADCETVDAAQTDSLGKSIIIPKERLTETVNVIEVCLG